MNEKTSTTLHFLSDKKILPDCPSSNKNVTIQTKSRSIFPGSKDLDSNTRFDVDKDHPLNAVVFVFDSELAQKKKFSNSTLQEIVTKMHSKGTGAFMLLQIQASSFILKDCNDTAPVVQDHFISTGGQKLKKFLKVNQGYSQPFNNMDNFFLKLFCTNELKLQRLQHNKSLNLRDYSKLRKKSLHSTSFLYENIYVGYPNSSTTTGTLDNLLTWVHYRTEADDSCVECYAVLCDDPTHTQQLKYSLSLHIKEKREQILLEANPISI